MPWDGTTDVFNGGSRVHHGYMGCAEDPLAQLVLLLVSLHVQYARLWVSSWSRRIEHRKTILCWNRNTLATQPSARRRLHLRDILKDTSWWVVSHWEQRSANFKPAHRPSAAGSPRGWRRNQTRAHRPSAQPRAHLFLSELSSTTVSSHFGLSNSASFGRIISSQYSCIYIINVFRDGYHLVCWDGFVIVSLTMTS